MHLCDIFQMCSMIYSSIQLTILMKCTKSVNQDWSFLRIVIIIFTLHYVYRTKYLQNQNTYLSFKMIIIV